jgi:hypothetical protein
MLIFNDSSIDSPLLNQCLNTFFPSFAFSYVDNMKIIAESFIPTIKKAYGQKDYNLHHLCQYLIYMTDLKNLIEAGEQNKNIEIHEKIGISLAFEILLDPKSKDSGILCKLFSLLSLNPLHQETLYQLYFLVPKLKKSITNKVTQKSFEKFEKNLKSNHSLYLQLEMLTDVDDKKSLESKIEKELQVYLNGELDEEEIVNKSKPKSKKSGSKKKVIRPKAGSKKSSQKRKVYSDQEEEEEDGFSDMESSPEKKVKKSRTKAIQSKKKPKMMDEDEIENLLNSDSEQVLPTSTRESISKLRKDVDDLIETIVSESE